MGINKPFINLSLGETKCSGNDIFNMVQSVAFSPNRELIATASDDHLIRIWKFKEGKIFQTIREHKDIVSKVSFHSEGNIIASSSWDFSVRIFDLETGLQIKKIHSHTRPVLATTFTPNGEIMASGGRDAIIYLWDTQTWKNIDKLRVYSTNGENLKFNEQGYVTSNKEKKVPKIDMECDFRSLYFTPDGKHLAAGGGDNVAYLWNLKYRKLVRSFIGHNGSINDVSINPRGVLLASASSDNTARIWDIETGETKKELKPNCGGVQCVAFSPDGDILATGSIGYGIVHLWDVKTGHILLELNCQGNMSVQSLAFSLDGEFLAVGKNSVVNIWKINN